MLNHTWIWMNCLGNLSVSTSVPSVTLVSLKATETPLAQEESLRVIKTLFVCFLLKIEVSFMLSSSVFLCLGWCANFKHKLSDSPVPLLLDLAISSRFCCSREQGHESAFCQTGELCWSLAPWAALAAGIREGHFPQAWFYLTGCPHLRREWNSSWHQHTKLCVCFMTHTWGLVPHFSEHLWLFYAQTMTSDSRRASKMCLLATSWLLPMLHRKRNWLSWRRRTR